MKRIIFCLLLVLICITGFAQEQKIQAQTGSVPLLNPDEEITISRVRVFLDDVEISSEDLESITAISAGTVLSFTKFKAGKKMTLKALEKEVRQTQLRLLNSGYFYNATVEIVPARKNPERRTIIINVTKGFLHRIGGGGIYATYGRVALGGKRNQLIGVVGWNVNGLKYIDENLFGLPLIAGASLYTNVPACFSKKGSGVGFNGSATFGVFINPDLRLCVDAVGFCNTKLGFVGKSFIVSPYLFNQCFVTDKLKTTSEIRLYFMPIVTLSNFSVEICQTVNYSPVRKLNFGVVVCGGVNFIRSESENSFAYDLSLEHSSVSSNSGLEKRSVRSGYTGKELFVKNYVLTSFEARFRAVDFVIAGTFPCNITPFVFADFALGQQKNELLQRGLPPQSAWTFFDAFGMGIQINFDCPVFAYFNFTYGLNYKGKGKFSFYTGLSF